MTFTTPLLNLNVPKSITFTSSIFVQCLIKCCAVSVIQNLKYIHAQCSYKCGQQHTTQTTADQGPHTDTLSRGSPPHQSLGCHRPIATLRVTHEPRELDVTQVEVLQALLDEGLEESRGRHVCGTLSGAHLGLRAGPLKTPPLHSLVGKANSCLKKGETL